MPIRATVKVTDDPKRWKALVASLRTEVHNIAVLGGVRQSEEPYEGGASLQVIASVHEFGGGPGGNIPERSYLRSTADENSRRYATILEKSVGSYIDEIARGVGGRAAATTMIVRLNRLGVKFVGDVQAKIRSNIPPALADSTVAAKGSSVALIHTSRLVQSIDYAVVRLRRRN